ncbi:protein kinase domain-containing protein [Agrobacterium rosae]|uniref:Protein kinase n=1 Tax=Agrobacterium rosae TaxID=1972867 RepID=A0AAW9FHI7_9HYPH|nr:protein kinase [Agrobacterium rosae]MDX8302298.1 protein kinase [Agrobacterium rosae]
MSNAEDVARHFADLWAAIRQADRPDDVIDRIRDALDRRTSASSQQNPVFIENSFTLEAVAYETESTQILHVTHRDLRTSFAIKTLQEKTRNDAFLVQNLRREAEIGLSMRHPCLQEISALLRLPDGRPGLLQPWTPVSLASLMTDRKLTRDEVSQTLHRVLGAVAALHAKDYVHGDITPANILLPDGDLEKARLADFGITLKTGEHYSLHGIDYAGSPEFSAPEQMAGSAAAHPLYDIYSVGKLAQRLLSATGSDKHEKLVRFAQLCTAEDASKRPQSAEDAALFL